MIPAQYFALKRPCSIQPIDLRTRISERRRLDATIVEPFRQHCLFHFPCSPALCFRCDTQQRQLGQAVKVSTVDNARSLSSCQPCAGALHSLATHTVRRKRSARFFPFRCLVANWSHGLQWHFTYTQRPTLAMHKRLCSEINACVLNRGTPSAILVLQLLG